MALHGKQRLGLLVPSQNTTMEDDFTRWMPDSVRMHVNRLYSSPERSGSFAEGLQAMGDRVEETARIISNVPLDVIAFGCTSGSFLNGLGYDLDIIRRIEGASGGVKTVATARAVIDALKELGVKKIAASSPYPEDINKRLRQFLADAGFEVVSFDNVEASQMGGIDSLQPEVAYELGKSVDRPEAEAIFISCTAFRAAEVVDDLEKATGKPVVTSNQATFWACMRALEVAESIPGAGKLLKERVPA